MPIISYPKMTVKYFHQSYVFVRADDASVNQYCTESGLSLSSYEKEYQRFSNDESLTYQYWDGAKWVLESGYSQVVASITHS